MPSHDPIIVGDVRELPLRYVTSFSALIQVGFCDLRHKWGALAAGKCEIADSGGIDGALAGECVVEEIDDDNLLKLERNVS